MRTCSPGTLPIFRSQLQADLLFHLLTSGTGLSVADLTRLTGSPHATVHREVNRLAGAGLLTTEHVGRTILYSPDGANPVLAPLRQLVVMTVGPVELLREELTRVPGITTAKIFGSWAARAAGEPGAAPGDIDLLIVGDIDRRALYTVLSDLEPRIGRPVNPTLISADRWHTSEDPFLHEIRRRPTIDLVDA